MKIASTPGGRVPSNLDHALVFDVNRIAQLKARIEELTAEKGRQRAEYREIKRTQRRLEAERKEKDKEVENLHTRCNELQMLKFGALIDLEALESFSVNDVGEALKEQLRVLEAHVVHKIKEMDEQVLLAKQELNEKLRTNTQSINGMVKLKDDRAFYDKELGEAQADVAVDSSFRNAQEAEEKKRLLQLSDLQTQEIQKLRDEIGRLSRKGGHVLPPSKASAVPTLPPI